VRTRTTCTSTIDDIELPLDFKDKYNFDDNDELFSLLPTMNH